MSTIGLASQIAVSFIITPVLVRSLGERAYGMWILVMALIGYYTVFDFGISSSVGRFVSRAAGRKDDAEINGIVNTSLGLYLIVGAACLLLSGVLGFGARWFVKDPREIEAVRGCILIIGSLVSFGFPIRVFQGVLKALLRYDLSVIAGLAKLAFVNLAIWFLLRDRGILFLAGITAAGGVIESALLVIFAFQAAPALRLSVSGYRKTSIREIMGYSWRSFVVTIMQQIRFKIDSLVVAGLLAVNLVTHYSIGTRFMEYFVEIVGNVAGGQLMSVFSQYEGRGDQELIRERFVSATRVSAILSVFVGTSLAFYGRAFIERWMGPHFHDSYLVLVILVGPFTLALSQSPTIGLLYGISKHHYISWTTCASAAVNLVLSLVLAKVWGMYGVAVGTAVELLLSHLFVYPVLVCRAIGLPLARYYFRALAVPIFVSLAALALWFSAVSALLRPDYLRIGILGIAQVIVFAPVVFFVVMNAGERALLWQAIRPAQPAS